jgi:stearoyl-CoA desaturase (delta-9 desaturase)
MSDQIARAADERVDWVGSIPFFVIHLSPLLVFWTGIRPVDVALCVGLYFFRMFFLSAGYHRYFAHRGYKMGRVMQFLMAFGGATSAQKGVLWWAGYHRHHHWYSDQPKDIHSPRKGFIWSHVGWILCPKYARTPVEHIKDFEKYPEIRWINKYHLVPPVLLAGLCYASGGASALVGGFLLSTVILYHGTFIVNSLTHVFGRRRYETTDTSRNSFLIALVTGGEGWHNNHHHYETTANNGFFWWEIDSSYYVLKVLSWFGLVWDLRLPPQHILEGRRATFDDNGMESPAWWSDVTETPPTERPSQN